MNKVFCKSKILVVISVFVILTLCACGSKNKDHNDDTKTSNKEKKSTTLDQTEGTEQKESAQNADTSKFIEWKFDITHDGVEDTIKVSTDLANYQSLAEPRFAVYSGKTDQKIWEKDISTSHTGFDGFYLYNDGDKDYLLEWTPYMSQGMATYTYKIFTLSENGEENIVETDDIGFSVDESEKDESDKSQLSTFIDKVNQYLNKSFVLVDTNDNGFTTRNQIIYSTKDNKIVLPYDATAEIKDVTKIYP